MQKVIERILNLLAFLLTVGRPVTADEIRHTVHGYDQPTDEAFRRTFERDKDLLRSLGVPLELQYTDMWQVEQGYRVPSEEYTLDDPGLTDEERSALMFAAQAVRFGGQPTELAAIFKLGGASATFTTSPIVADLGYDLDLLGGLFEAVADRRTVRFTYRDKNRSIHPFGLVHRFGHWYVVGPEVGDTTTKAFRVDRMMKPVIGDAPGAFDRPAGFDPRAAVADAQSGASARMASIRFDNDVVAVALNRSRASIIVEAGVDTTLVDVPIASNAGLVSWLLGFDDRAILEGPQDLVDELLSFLEVPS